MVKRLVSLRLSVTHWGHSKHLGEKNQACARFRPCKWISRPVSVDSGQGNTARARQKRAKSCFGVKNKEPCCGFLLYMDGRLVSAGVKEPLAVENWPISPSNVDGFRVQGCKCGRIPCEYRSSSCPGHSAGRFRSSKVVLGVKCGRIPCVLGASPTLNMDGCRD